MILRSSNSNLCYWQDHLPLDQIAYSSSSLNLSTFREASKDPHQWFQESIPVFVQCWVGFAIAACAMASPEVWVTVKFVDLF